MRILTALLLMPFMLAAQKVVKPKNYTGEHFQLTINGQDYEKYISGKLKSAVYIRQWKQFAQQKAKSDSSILSGTSIRAMIRIQVSVDYTGKIFVSDHNSMNNSPELVTDDELYTVIKKICTDVQAAIKKKGVVTPAWSSLQQMYVNDEKVVAVNWEEVVQ